MAIALEEALVGLEVLGHQTLEEALEGLEVLGLQILEEALVGLVPQILVGETPGHLADLSDLVQQTLEELVVQVPKVDQVLEALDWEALVLGLVQEALVGEALDQPTNKGTVTKIVHLTSNTTQVSATYLE